MKSGYLLFFDLDGTVLLGGRLPEEHRKALLKAKENGNFLIINSGRSRAYIPAAVLQDIPWDGMICGSVYVEWQSEVLHNHILSDKTLKEVIDYVAKAKLRLVMEGVEKNYTYGMPDSSIAIDQDVEGFLASSPNVSKVTFLDKPDPTQVPEFSGIRTIFFATYAEGIAKGYTKKTGMEMLLQKSGKDVSMTCAFGDSENDMEMLRFASLSAVMKHAPEIYDSFVQLRCESEFGVAEALEKLNFI